MSNSPTMRTESGSLAAEARRFGPAVFDQGVWSLAGFATSALVGRMLGPEGLGWFALGVAILFGIGGLVNSLVLDPAAVIGPRDYGDRIRTYGGRLLMAAGALGAVLCLAGIGLLIVGSSTLVRVTGAALVVSLPAFLAWTARRLPYLTDQPWIALAGSVSYVVSVLVCLALLGSLDLITPVTALLTLGLASLVQVATGLLVWRPDVRLGETLTAWPDLRTRHWSFGRWLLAAEGASWILNYGMAAISAAVIGLEAAGGFRASQILLRPYGIVFIGLSLAYVPRLSRLLTNGDRGAAASVVARLGWALSAIGCIVLGILVVAGDWIMALIFGSEFRSYGWLAAAIAGAMVLHGWISAYSMGLQSRDRTRDVFLGQAASALTTLIGSLVLGLWLGLVGFAITFWLATIARFAVVVVLYRRSLRTEVSTLGFST